MRKIAVTGAALLLAGALSGCAASPPEDATVPTLETTPTPTIDPGPVELTIEEAGQRYLELVCDNNLATGELQAAFDATEEEFLGGGEPDLTAIKAVASKRADFSRQAIEHFDDSYYLWPEEVADQIPHVRSSYMAELAPLDAVINAQTYESAYYVNWGQQTPEQASAGQEIRYQLGLSTDTQASCVGHEGGIAKLTAEKAERDAALNG